MTCQSAIEKIYTLPRFNRQNTLDPVVALLHALHDPQDTLRFIHVAGTNGKGSISTMVAAVLRAAGHRTGLYTSPYINDFRERFRINDDPVNATAFARAARKVFTALQKLPAENGLSQFDVVTAIAFLLFAEEGCDTVVLECGLGGRLDATNVIAPPQVAVIGNIGYDHTDLLGDTVSAITAEKCGIIKPGTGAVICAPQDYPEAERTVESYAMRAGVPYTAIKDGYEIKKCSLGALCFTYQGTDYTSSLAAAYQVKNAVAAIEVIRALRAQGVDISDEALRYGLSHAFIPARLELASLYPHVLLDGAHNPDGVRAMCESVSRLAPQFERLYCIVGMLQDKAPERTLAAFFESPILQERLAGVMTVTPASPRACLAEVLATILSDRVAAPVIPCPAGEEAIGRVVSQMQGKDLLLCFGSLYMMGDLRRAIQNRYTTPRR